MSDNATSTATEALKADINRGVRLVCGYRWMVFAQYNKRWIVYEKKPYAKKTTEVIDTNNEGTAITHLIQED